MHQRTRLFLVILLGTGACQGDRMTGPTPDLATAAVTNIYDWFTAGAYHTCLSRRPSDSNTWTFLCWGAQPGAGSYNTRPQAVPNNTGAVFTNGDGGGSHHCELSGTRAYCWGSNTYGQLGDGTTITRSAPTLVKGGITWLQITTGLSHTCGVSNIGTPYCWGRGFDGALGNGGTADKLVPTGVVSTVAFSSLYGGEQFTCGLQSGSGPWTIYCWGRNYEGQLGNGSTALTQLRPGAAVVGGAKWHSMAVGLTHVCANTWGAVTPVGAPPQYCWGSGSRGQLGNGQTINQRSPVAVLGNVRMHPTVAGQEFTCGRRADNGTMYCWGRGDFGSLGNGLFGDRTTPTGVTGNVAYTHIPRRMAAGRHHMVVQRSADNAVVTWGLNHLGQLGDGTTNTRPSPVVILSP
jgi:alpha-tubulin suppressor-like RCC1 family protein